jgi:dTDP-4-amino-4,6-dideoxygalactose transaminase
MLDLRRLHAPIAGELRQAFDETLESGRFVMGPAVERFEESLAAAVGAPHAVGVSSGTDALLALMTALDVGPGDEVITTPFTFFATAGAIARRGATPVFADIEPASFNLDPSAVAAAVTERTVGVVPAHLFGQTAEMDPLVELADQRGLWVVEDAAQAIGARYRGRSAGTLARAAALSFFPAKNLGALGDAGAVLTGDGELAVRVRALREHGAAPKYHHRVVGGNFRLDALQAALLQVKLPLLAGWQQGRRRVAGRYAELLGGIEGLVLPVELDGRVHVYNQYVVRAGHGRRDDLRDALVEAGIGCAVYYPEPLHLQPCFASLGHRRGDLPEAERAAREALALPIDPHLTEGDQQRICDVIRRTLRS